MNCLSSVLSLAVSAPHAYREQQMLDGHELMPCFPRTGERIIQAKFEFLTKHRLCLF